MKKIYSILTILCAAFVAFSCSNDIESIEESGYINLEMNTLVSTHTRVGVDAPDGYNARKLHITIAQGETTVMESDYTEADGFVNENMKGNVLLPTGTYTVTAHSANWDGTGTGFDAPYYYAQTTVDVEAKKAKKVRLTLTQANVKVTVNWDESFQTYFNYAESKVSSANATTARIFVMGEEQKPAYFPVGKLTLKVSVINKAGDEHIQTNTIDDVNARDHFIINYKIADAGKEGEVTVKIDDATNTYTYTVAVPVAPSVSVIANAPSAGNIWSRFVVLTGEASGMEEYHAENMKLQWKKASDSEWTDVAGSNLPLDSKDAFTYTLKGLTAATDYVYRVVYTEDGEDYTSAEVEFTTAAETALYNGGFEDWYDVGNYYSPNDNANRKYWDTSNPGSASFNYVVSDPSTDFVHGGEKSAYLHADYAVIKLAAGSIYTGQFGKVSGTSASLNWGVPFTSRPTALHGFKSYKPGTINRGSQPSGVGAPESGSNDIGIIRVALMTEQLAVNNKDMSTFPDWQTDSRIIGYGVLEFNQDDNGQWVEFTIPIEYHSLTQIPTHILVMGATCKYGDYFYGSDKSKLWLDDFELVYGDEPTVKE